MPRLPRLAAEEAEKQLLNAGFSSIRSEGSHRIYVKERRRIIVPFHSGTTLHPKIVKQGLEAVEEKN